MLYLSEFCVLYPSYVGYTINRYIGTYYLIFFFIGFLNHIYKSKNRIINIIDIYYCHSAIHIHPFLTYYYGIVNYNYLFFHLGCMSLCYYCYNYQLKITKNYTPYEYIIHSVIIHLLGSISNAYFLHSLNV